jgi:hypothetical protein
MSFTEPFTRFTKSKRNAGKAAKRLAMAEQKALVRRAEMGQEAGAEDLDTKEQHLQQLLADRGLGSQSSVVKQQTEAFKRARTRAEEGFRTDTELARLGLSKYKKERRANRRLSTIKNVDDILTKAMEIYAVAATGGAAAPLIAGMEAAGGSEYVPGGG